MEGKFDEATARVGRQRSRAIAVLAGRGFNLGLVEAELSLSSPAVSPAELKIVPTLEAAAEPARPWIP